MRAKEAARQIVELVVCDAKDRSLLDGVDADILEEIRDSWTTLVAEKISAIEEADK